MSRARRLPCFTRYTPRAAPNTRSRRRPVENDGSAATPAARTRRGLPAPFFRYSLPPETKAIALQSYETVTAVTGAAAWCPPGSSRRGLRSPPPRRVTRASSTPLVSPPTMFDADERNATHEGRWSKPPSIDGVKDGPFEGRPDAVRETMTVRRGIHFAPKLSMRPPRSTANTSLRPFLSLWTRLL